jgi:hypothetical protein
MISTRNTSFTRFYFVTIDCPVTKIFLVDYVSFCKLIDRLVKTYIEPKGYSFQQISCKEGMERRKLKKNKIDTFHIRLSMNETVTDICNLPGLSCADVSENIIYINAERWMYGSKESKLSLDEYRQYVILHEIFHLLGRGHKRCPKDKNEPCSIMYQQTVSKGCCKPNIIPFHDT